MSLDQALSRASTLWRRITWTGVRRAAVLIYLVVLATSLVRDGVPLDQLTQFVWIIAGLATLCIGRPWRTWAHLLITWTIFIGVLQAYSYSRGMAYRYTGPSIGGYPAEGARNTLGMPLHVMFPIDFDRWLFGGTLPTQWVQAHFHPGHAIPILAVVVSMTYLSHFFVMPITAIVLWIRRRKLFTVWMSLALSLAVVGVSIYFLYPMTPPWLASQQGYIGGARIWGYAGEGWQYLGIKFAAALIDSGRALANPVAAMPSLHVAYATLATGFFFFTARRWWIRTLVCFYPLLMGFSLVYAGEHYVTDEIFGVLTSACIIAGWRVLRAWRLRRRAAVELAAGDAAGVGPDDVAAGDGIAGGLVDDGAADGRAGDGVAGEAAGIQAAGMPAAAAPVDQVPETVAAEPPSPSVH